MLAEFLLYDNFIINKYHSIYLKLITKVINENRIYNSSIHEYHHILPKSVNGTVTIPLTFKEHFIAHRLLTKFTKGKLKHSMIFAFRTFRN